MKIEVLCFAHVNTSLQIMCLRDDSCCLLLFRTRSSKSCHGLDCQSHSFLSSALKKRPLTVLPCYEYVYYINNIPFQFQIFNSPNLYIKISHPSSISFSSTHTSSYSSSRSVKSLPSPSSSQSSPSPSSSAPLVLEAPSADAVDVAVKDSAEEAEEDSEILSYDEEYNVGVAAISEEAEMALAVAKDEADSVEEEGSNWVSATLIVEEAEDEMTTGEAKLPTADSMTDAGSVALTLTLSLTGVLPSTSDAVSVSAPLEDEEVRLSEETVTGSVLWLAVALGVTVALASEGAEMVGVAMAVELRLRVMV